MKNIAISRIKFIFLLIFLFQFNAVKSDVKIFKAEINPLNRVMIYCSEKPLNYSSELSLDKTKITLKINKSTAVESVREVHSQGVVQDLYIQNFKNFSQVSINLKEKRGYNANFLPMSQAIMVEVFDWSKLSPDEDDYRSGLLAFENGIMNSAKKYFSKSAKNGNANSSGFLGLIDLKEGRVNEALKNLHAAERFDSNIPDFYAALSQIYSLKNDKPNAEKYKKIYSKKSGLSSYETLVIPPIPENDTNTKQSISFLDRLNDPDVIDSSEIHRLDSIKKQSGNDSIAKLSSKKQDTIIKKVFPSENADNTSQMPAWLTKTAFYIAFASFLFIIMLISLYFRWRKQQINKIRKETTKKFSDKLRTAQSSMSGSAHAAKLYKKSEKIIDDNLNGETRKKPENRISPETVNETDNADDVQKIALEILASKVSGFEFENQKTTIEDEPKIQEISHHERKANPRIELAMHLREEQMKLKEKNIESLSKSEIPADLSKLSEVAKKLGIEKSSLETRRSITNLESDKHSLQKLSEKFNKESKEK